MAGEKANIEALLQAADDWHEQFGTSVHDKITASIYETATAMADRAVRREEMSGVDKDLWLDRLLTSRLLGFPVMLALLAVVFWLTIAGSNIPSAFLAGLLMEKGGLSGWCAEYLGLTTVPWFLSFSIYEILQGACAALRAPWWLSGFFVDGVYLGLAWVVAVMLPPMAIFFPLFTLLEDVGLLPRVAFNLDRFFRAVGAHGKQALTMAMGFGCNAAGVIACRIIDSPRERLIAILTNTFVPCNGRWPTLILMASFIAASGIPAAYGSLLSVAALTAATLIGIGTTLVVSWLLSRTLLRGVASSFILEMPPYRRPQAGRIIYTSLIDRTWFVLRRAIICAVPAGALIWLLGAIPVGETSLFRYMATMLNPVGQALGLDGVILIAFIFAVPANEIVIPTVIMGYMNIGRMMEIDNPVLLFSQNGWTWLTAVCVMLFSLLHYPCSTVSFTVWAETRSVKWTVLANAIPLAVAVATCLLVARTARYYGVGIG